MGFSAPSIPEPKTPPPPASPVDPAVLARRRRARLMTRSGRLASILTGPQGLVSRRTISAPTLLGGGGAPAGASAGSGGL